MFDKTTNEISEIETANKNTSASAEKLAALAEQLEETIKKLPSLTPSTEFKTWAEKLKEGSTPTPTNADLVRAYDLLEEFAKDATNSIRDAAKIINEATNSLALRDLDNMTEPDLTKEIYKSPINFFLRNSVGNSNQVAGLAKLLPEVQDCYNFKYLQADWKPDTALDMSMKNALHKACLLISESGAKKATDETKSILTKIVEATKRDVTKLLNKVAEKEKSKTDIKARQEKLNKELSLREKEGGARKDKVADNLENIILAIFVTILLGLIIIRIKPDELATLLVRERTVTEAVSIGAFLSVVVFLGAGEFVQKETLGTLLGTLAGYLFTRRATPTPPTDGGGDGQTSTALGTPGKPKWDSPTHTLTLANDTSGATKHHVWFIDLSLTNAGAPPSARKIGDTNTRSFVVPPDLLHAGSHCQAWFQAVNAAGDGPEGPRVDFTV